MTVVDATGTAVGPVGPDARIVSLVPSVSELLHVLGAEDRVVGVTTFCVAPPGGFRGARRVRGTKNPDVDAIVELEPDLVFANLEENRERHVIALREAGLDVHVSYPRDVEEARELIADVAELTGADGPASAVLDDLDTARSGAASRRPGTPVPVLCPIWRDPWMAVGPSTYAGALLGECGLEVRPPTGETYPQVQLDDVLREVDAVLLPSEPYAFTARDAAEMAGRGVAAMLVDGAALTWHGPRTATGLRLFSALAADLADRQAP